MFKIGIPLRLVGTRNADRAEATKTREWARDEVVGGTEEMRAAEKRDVRYCFIIKGSFLLARESFQEDTPSKLKTTVQLSQLCIYILISVHRSFF